MKSEEEVARAHDLLVGILLSKETHAMLTPEQIERITIAADAMCWILGHEHNQTFANNLVWFEKFAASQGFELRRVQ